MRRKRRQRDRALMLTGASADVIGQLVGKAKTAALKHGYGFVDDSVIDAVLEAVDRKMVRKHARPVCACSRHWSR